MNRAIALFLTLVAAVAANADNVTSSQPTPNDSPITLGDVKFEGYVQVGVVRNNSAPNKAAGLTNYPIAQASDEGFQFNTIQTFIHKDIGGNLTPKAPPKAAPQAVALSWGFMLETMYGRNGQAARSFGFDNPLAINHPGDEDPAKAAKNRQNFLAFPNVYGQVALPYWQGMALTAGRFGAGISYEIPVQTRSSPNFFYSRSYAFVASPNQVTGVLLSANLLRNASGYWLGEMGVVNGWQNWKDNNDSKTLLGALRWRSVDLSTVASLSFMTGDEQNHPDITPQYPYNKVVSPRGQLRNHISINGVHKFNAWSVGAEALWGHQDGDGRPDTIQIGPGGHPNFSGAYYSGINAFGTDTINPKWALGARAEYFKNSDGFALQPTTAAKADLEALTLGLHYDPFKALRIRPEIRFDRQVDAAAGVKIFGNGNATKQTMLAVDFLFYF